MSVHSSSVSLRRSVRALHTQDSDVCRHSVDCVMLSFVLKDPTSDLLQIAESRGMLESRFHALSLGQGQAPFATRMLKEGIQEVRKYACLFVFLADY